MIITCKSNVIRCQSRLYAILCLRVSACISYINRIATSDGKIGGLFLTGRLNEETKHVYDPVLLYNWKFISHNASCAFMQHFTSDLCTLNSTLSILINKNGHSLSSLVYTFLWRETRHVAPILCNPIYEYYFIHARARERLTSFPLTVILMLPLFEIPTENLKWRKN